jgi:malonate-semialdehyde dehydrogenase (acetylating) / methylmalonate-semialdehyde dehydrogenase
MPDTDMEVTAKIVSDSAFGCAGQRCLAVSVVVTVADSAKRFNEALLDITSKIKTGDGLQQGTAMGPVIMPDSKERSSASSTRA